MQASSIWAGEEYAWAYNRPKTGFPMNARKCVAIATRRTRYIGNERLSTEVLIKLDGTEIEKWVPAREIVDFWDAYFDEYNHHLEVEAERKRQAQERAEAAKAVELQQKKVYADFLGIDVSVVVSLTDRFVSLERSKLEDAISKRGTYG